MQQFVDIFLSNDPTAIVILAIPNSLDLTKYILVAVGHRSSVIQLQQNIICIP